MILGDLPQFFKCRVVASSKILTRAEEVPELVLFALEARTGAAVDARDLVEHVGWMMGLRCPEETAFSILTKNFHVRRHCCSRLRSTLVSMCIFPPMASEAMATSKRPLRSFDLRLEISNLDYPGIHVHIASNGL